MDDLALFDVTPAGPPASAPSPPKLTDGQRRIRRQRARIEAGWHPLDRPLRLHPDVPGLRCGDCRFRQLLSGGVRDFPKCTWPGPDGPWPRVSHGPGTDIRAWWPACTDFQPKETP